MCLCVCDRVCACVCMDLDLGVWPVGRIQTNFCFVYSVEYTPDMEDDSSADDCDSMSDGELDVSELEMREVENGWR